MHWSKSKISLILGSRWFVASSIALLILIISEIGFYLYNKQQRIEKQQDAIEIGYNLAAQFDREINKLIYLNSGLEAYITNNHQDLNQQELSEMLSAIYNKEPKLLRNFGVAEGYVLKWVYPIIGNEKALGIDYTQLPEQLPMIEQAIQKKQGTLDGPINLVQGGIGLIYRTPVFVDSVYWGIISTVIDLDELFIAAFGDVSTESIDLAISSQSSPQAKDIIYGKISTFQNRNAVIIDVPLPNNHWHYAVNIRNSNLKNSFTFLLRLLSYLIVILSFAVIFYIRTLFQRSQNILNKYKLLAEKSTDIVWVYNIRLKKFSYLSPSVKNFIGFQPEEIYNSTIHDLIHASSIVKIKHDLPIRYFNFLKGISDATRYTDELLFNTKNGTSIWAETIFHFHFIDKDQVEIIGVSRDINQRKKAELELQENEKRFKSTFDSSNDGLLLIEPESTLIFMGNKKIAEMLQYSPKELAGKTLNTLHDKNFNYKYYLPIPNDKTSNGLTSKGLWVNRKDGSSFYADINFSEIEFSDHKFILCAYRDVTQRMEMQEELIQLNQEKDRFISVLAHDLRSPFNGLLGLLEVILQDFQEMDDDHKKKLLKHASKSANEIFQLLDELLLWSRSKAGRIQIEGNMVNLMLLTNSIMNLYQSSIQSKQLKFDLQFSYDFNIFADENQLKIIMRNLISNAIKFCHTEGKITIRAMEENRLYWIEVIDDGIGMSQELVENIWQYDKNESRSGTANEKGTGFGLILIKELIENHGGTIGVSSVLDKGTTFKFSIPK